MAAFLTLLAELSGPGLLALGLFELLSRRRQKREARLRALEDWKQHIEDELRTNKWYRPFTR